MVVLGLIVNYDVLAILTEAMFHPHYDAGLIIGLVIVVGVPGSSSVRLNHEKAVIVLHPCLHIGCPALVAIERSQAIVAIVHVRWNAIFSSLNNEHGTILSFIPHDHCLLSY